MRSIAVHSVQENGANSTGSPTATNRANATKGVTGISGTVKMTDTATTMNKVMTVTMVLSPRAPRE
jgi:hypothetical protein